MNIDAIIRKCKWMSDAKLKKFAQENYQKAHEYLKSVATEKQATTLCLGTVWTCCALDRGFSRGEWELVSYLAPQFSYDEAYNIACEFHQSAATDTLRDLIACVPADAAEMLVSVCVAVLLSDKKMDGKEMEFLRSL